MRLTGPDTESIKKVWNQNNNFYDPGAPENTPEQDKVQSPEQNK
jgi:hypothetical protein